MVWLDRKTSLGNRLRRYTYAMIQFIDKQTIKLLHEAAPIKKVRRRKPLPSITVERARINQRISHVLSLIDIGEVTGVNNHIYSENLIVIHHIKCQAIIKQFVNFAQVMPRTYE